MQPWWSEETLSETLIFVIIFQVSRNKVIRLNQEVESQVQEAQDLLSDALDIAEDIGNGAAVSDVSTSLNSV